MGGKSASIVSVARSSKPLRVGVVLDIGSGQTEATWNAARLIIHNIQPRFSEGTEFSLVAFDDRVEQSVPLQRGLHILDEFVDGLSLSKNKESKTGLYEALAAGIRTLDAPQSGDALFLVTAWEDAGKSDAQTTAVEQLSSVGVRLFGISFDSSKLPGTPRTGAFISKTSFAPIEEVAQRSGGLWMRASGYPPALDLSASVIADAYTVGLKLGQPLVKVGELKIELVKGDQIGLKPNLKVSDCHPFLSASALPVSLKKDGIARPSKPTVQRMVPAKKPPARAALRCLHAKS